MENEPRSVNTEEVIERVSKPLKRIALAVPRVYFGSDIRNEQIDGKQAFDHYESIQPGLCRKITAALNSHLQQGDQVIVLDFPYPDRETNQVQVISKNAYLRQVNGLMPMVRDFVLGTLSTKLTTPSHKNVTGALNFETRASFGERIIYTTSWNDEETQRRRFAILSHQSHGWKLLLDFRLPGESKKPTWKFNPELLY